MAVYETTLEKLSKSGLVTTISGAALLQQYRLGSLADVYWQSQVAAGRIQAEDVYVAGANPAIMAEVTEDLRRRLGTERVVVWTDAGQTVLALKANFEKLIKWNLGLSTAELQAVAGQGFYTVIRPTKLHKGTCR